MIIHKKYNKIIYFELTIDHFNFTNNADLLFNIAQPPCQPRIFTVQAGQRFCERQCITGPGTGGTRCATARVTTTVRLCPMNCCRRGSICQWVYQV